MGWLLIMKRSSSVRSVQHLCRDDDASRHDLPHALLLAVQGIVPTMFATISDLFSESHAMTVFAEASATSAVMAPGLVRATYC